VIGMQKQKLEKWIWILIYGGMLGASLGWFLHPSAAAAAWTLMVGGGVLAAAGVILILVRSRMGP
jgi:F0F1-type ATP synthase assembly protein I